MEHDSACPLTAMCSVKDVAKYDDAALTEGVRKGSSEGRFHMTADRSYHLPRLVIETAGRALHRWLLSRCTMQQGARRRATGDRRQATGDAD